MQKVVIVELVDVVHRTEIICEAWNSWHNSGYMNFLFLDVQETGTQQARRTLRHMSKAVATVTSEMIEWEKSGSSPAS